jgi:hypothetical protein
MKFWTMVCKIYGSVKRIYFDLSTESFVFWILSLTFSNSLLAQTNSVARIDKPIGITIKAGPGKTISKIPIARIVNPITVTKILLICF